MDNIRKRHGIAPAPQRGRNTTWRQFLKAHWDGLIAADFFTTEVLCWNGLITCYTLFAIELPSRLLYVCGTTESPNDQWMKQVARQLTDGLNGFARRKTHLIIDRDTKYCLGFRQILEDSGVKIMLCPPRVPQCNAHAERFVRSIKEECLNRLIFFSRKHLELTIRCYADFYIATQSPRAGKQAAHASIPSDRRRDCVRETTGRHAQLFLPKGRVIRALAGSAE